MKKIVTLGDKAEWVSYVEKAAYYDFYHSWHYHNLDKNGAPFMFVYQHDEDFIAFPLIKRKIGTSPYCDFTCVYGYSGPISNKKMDELDAAMI